MNATVDVLDLLARDPEEARRLGLVVRTPGQPDDTPEHDVTWDLTDAGRAALRERRPSA
jgi:hypothetical protein